MYYLDIFPKLQWEHLNYKLKDRKPIIPNQGSAYKVQD